MNLIISCLIGMLLFAGVVNAYGIDSTNCMEYTEPSVMVTVYVDDEYNCDKGVGILIKTGWDFSFSVPYQNGTLMYFTLK